MTVCLLHALAAVAGAGAGVAAAATLYPFFRRHRKRKAGQPAAAAPPGRDEGPAPRRREARPWAVLAAALGGIALLWMLFWGTPYLAFSGIGAVFGPLLGLFLERVNAQRRRFVRLREVAVLYESVDLFARAGFTVRQALQMSVPLVPGLREEVMRCLDRWPAGPLRAIQRFGEEVGLEEAQVLTGVLMHAEELGPGRVSGIMAEEAARLEEIRRALAEIRVASRPVYLTVYNFLPVVAALGMLIAPLAWRAVTMISSMRAGAFN